MAPTEKQSSKEAPVRKVSVAVVGLGFMGVTHLRAYLANPSARVTAVCDSVRLPANGVLRGVAGNIKQTDEIHFGAEVKVFRALSDLLEDPGIEFVDLCTPTPLHAEQAIASLRAGKHVLCEKPLARTSEAAREIVRVAESAAGMLMPAMCMRFWPGWGWLKQVVEEKAFGRVLAARFRRGSARPAWGKEATYRGGTSGGALFDLHIHDADFVNYLFGRPTRLYATGVTGPDGSVDHVVAQYHFPAGPAVYAEGSWLLAEGFSMAYSLHCERATLDFDSTRGKETLVISEAGRPRRVVHLEQTDGYAAETRYAINCIAGNQNCTVVTAQDGVTALEICEAEETSVRSGSVVAL
jgi:predicted dehydrogenase